MCACAFCRRKASNGTETVVYVNNDVRNNVIDVLFDIDNELVKNEVMLVVAVDHIKSPCFLISKL